MNELSFSVLMSVYANERADYLSMALHSITDAQTLLPNEIVLVKDGLLTRELDYVCDDFVHRYPEIVKIVTIPKNVGLGKALSEGMKYCSHELIARMDSDDVSAFDRFEKQIEILKKHPDVDIVSAWISEFDGDVTNVVSVRKLPEDHFSIYKFAKKRCPINHPVVMFKKSEVLLAGGYIHMPLYEDYYLWIRMLMNGSKFYNIQESLLLFRFSFETIKRRGGVKYAVTEMKFLTKIYKYGFISLMEYIYSLIVRLISRLIPNYLRILLYKKILR